ncbi:MAG: nucleotidyltransferase domain-containing protein [Candidatus Woesearchaeota archaeon]
MVLGFTRLQQAVFRELCRSAGDPLTVSELARRTRATPAGVTKAIGSMSDVVHARRDARVNAVFVELVRSRRARDLKRVENLRQVYMSGLVDHLVDSLAGGSIILFGSYSRGEDTVRSDIDLAVIGVSERELALRSFETQLMRTINVSWFGSFGELSAPMRESLCAGIPLEGGISYDQVV